MLKCLLVASVVAVALAQTPPGPKKQLIAHRGASAYAPEHTIAAYTRALEQGADFVEQDLAVTKDGVLVCIHDLTLERTTNVEDVFPHRFSADVPAAAATPDRSGESGHRWLVNDFTLEEIKRLDAGSWFGPAFAGATIPTFQEAIDLVHGKAGMYPELKDPEFYRKRGVRPDVLLAAALKRNGLVANPKTPIIIQSFDDTTLKQLARDLPQVPRVFLVDPQGAARVESADKLKEIAVLGIRRRTEQGAHRRASGDGAVGSRGRPYGDVMDVPFVEHDLPVGPRRDGKVPVRARRRRRVHRQSRSVSETLRPRHFRRDNRRLRCAVVASDEDVVEPAAQHGADRRRHDRHPPPAVARRGTPRRPTRRRR